jgi:hypothetical protein
VGSIAVAKPSKSNPFFQVVMFKIILCVCGGLFS